MQFNLWAMYTRAVIDRPRSCLGLVGLLVVLLATQLPDFALDASGDSLLLESDTGIELYRAVRARYGSDDFLIVTWTPRQGRDLFSGAALDALQGLRDELAALPQIESVTSILDVPLLQSPPLSPQELADGAPTLLSARADRELAKTELKESPLYSNRLMSPDGNTTALQVTLVTDEDYARLLRRRGDLRAERLKGRLSREQRRHLADLEQHLRHHREEDQAKLQRTVTAVRAILEDYRDDAELHLGGLPMINADMIRFIRHDLVVFGIGLTLALGALLAIIFRRVRWVLLPLANCAASIVAMMGLLALIGWPVTVVSSNFVSLMLILTLSLNVHLVVRHRELHSDNPDWGQRRLVLETVRNKANPAFYTAVTTMVAFASLLVSDIRPVIDFGWMIVLGMALAFVLTLIVLPASLMLYEPGEPPEISHWTNRITGSFSWLIDRLPRTTLVVYGLLGAAAVVGISRLSVDNRFVDYFKSDTAIHQGIVVIDERLGGTTPLDVILDPDPEFLEELELDDELDLLGDPGFAATSYWYNTARTDTLRAAHESVERRADVGKVVSLWTTMQVLQTFVGEAELDNLELSVIYKRMPAEVREALLDPYLGADGNQARIAARVYETSDELERDELLVSIRRYLVDDLGIGEERVHLTGLMVLYNNVLKSLLASQVTTASAVAILVLQMFILAFRSLPVALVALAPTALSAAFVLGLMSLLGIPLDIMTITIAAIVIGIGVDDTIHYVYRFQEEFAECADYDMTVKRCHGSIGHAMYYTSIIIMLGFSILAFSSFVPTIYFGLLTALAMGVALVSNLTLLPLMLAGLEVLGEPGDAGEGAS